MAKKNETIEFEEQADSGQPAPEFGSHEGAEFESEVIPGADSFGEGDEFQQGVGTSGEGDEPEHGVGTSGEGDELEHGVGTSGEGDELEHGVGTSEEPEEDVYTVIDNFWWNGKNRLKGEKIALTPDEFNKLSEHVHLGE